VKFLELKPLTAALLPAAVALDQRSLGGLWTNEGYQRELESPNSDLLVLQPVVPDVPSSCLVGVACVWAIVDEAHVTLLAVDPDYQRQGLGQVLLYALLCSAWQRQLKWATLEVRASNEAAIALYRKFGFQDVGRRPKYYQDTGEDALILWRKGLQHPEFRDRLNAWQKQIRDRLQLNGWTLELGNWSCERNFYVE
jgi:[ribosomal protein S18]-alanine N-acetyltransferase